MDNSLSDEILLFIPRSVFTNLPDCTYNDILFHRLASFLQTNSNSASSFSHQISFDLWEQPGGAFYISRAGSFPNSQKEHSTFFDQQSINKQPYFNSKESFRCRRINSLTSFSMQKSSLQIGHALLVMTYFPPLCYSASIEIEVDMRSNFVHPEDKSRTSS